jgi:hypothetical protein
MDEGRKRVLGIMASILAARKLASLREQNVKTGSPVFVAAIANAISDAEAILKRIDHNSHSEAIKFERKISGTR